MMNSQNSVHRLISRHWWRYSIYFLLLLTEAEFCSYFLLIKK